jgi:hypothetical protein
LGNNTLSTEDMFNEPEVSETHLLGIFMEAWSLRHDLLLTHCTPLLSLENGEVHGVGVVERVQL